MSNSNFSLMSNAQMDQSAYGRPHHHHHVRRPHGHVRHSLTSQHMAFHFLRQQAVEFQLY